MNSLGIGDVVVVTNYPCAQYNGLQGPVTSVENGSWSLIEVPGWGSLYFNHQYLVKAKQKNEVPTLEELAAEYAHLKVEAAKQSRARAEAESLAATAREESARSHEEKLKRIDEDLNPIRDRAKKANDAAAQAFTKLQHRVHVGPNHNCGLRFGRKHISSARWGVTEW